ncbi:MAG: 3,4-dihydroxy-2-butanone-4-phosphate synthase [Alphaproteobacteria bacterium]|nr:MAG: 3,4-dihydroxy-2-butanone-4-phosphate synthase [Alphaproteobacteria bacterium]
MKIIEDVIKDLKAGHLVLVTDDDDRENEADLLMAAEFITVEKINFFFNHARGLITNPISSTISKKLNLPLMVPENEGTLQTAFTVSIDAVLGTHTGISSTDRTTTIKKLSDPKAQALDFERPGHVFPLIAHDQGVLARKGHTEAAIDLMKLAGLNQVAVLCETLNCKGDALKGEELLAFAKTYKIKLITIEEIKNYLLSR